MDMFILLSAATRLGYKWSGETLTASSQIQLAEIKDYSNAGTYLVILLGKYVWLMREDNQKGRKNLIKKKNHFSPDFFFFASYWQIVDYKEFNISKCETFQVLEFNIPCPLPFYFFFFFWIARAC